MAHFIDLNTFTNTLLSTSKLRETRKIVKSSGFVCRKTTTDDSVQLPRRMMTLGFAVSIALTGTFSGNDVSLAQDNNGFWIDGPLPTPPIYNSKQSSLSKLLMLDLISLPWFLISFSFLFFFFVEKHIDFVLNKI